MTDRSLVYARAMPPDDDGNAVIETLCDCGVPTELHIEISGLGALDGEPGSAEAAWTCDGCGTAHWFAVAVIPKEASHGE